MKLIKIAVLLVLACPVYAQVGTPALVTSSGNTNNGATAVATGTCSPTGGNFLLLVLAGRAASASTLDSVKSTFTTSPSNDRTDWTVVSGARETGNGAQIFYAYAFAGSSPGSGVATAYLNAGQLRQVIYLIQVSNVSTSSPIAESNNSNTGTASTASVSLGGVAANNIAISGIGSRSSGGTIDFGTGETEITELEHASSLPINLQTQYSTDAAHDWSSLGDSHSYFIIELAEAVAGAERRVIVVD